MVVQSEQSLGLPVDLWLSRFGHAAQIGLAIATVAAFFLTVVPLYQKAALEEAIAQREIELKSQNRAVQDAYVKLRQYATRQFIMGAGAKCTGLLTEPLSHETYIITTDANTCLLSSFASSGDLKQLRPTDYTLLKQRIEKIAEELKVDQQKARKEYDTLETRAARDPTVLGPPGQFGAGLIKVLEHQNVQRGQLADLARTMSFDATRLRISTDLADKIREKIFSLTNIEWASPDIEDAASPDAAYH